MTQNNHGLLSVDFSANNRKQLFMSSLRDTGFAIIKNAPIASDSIEKAYQQWDLFFNEEQDSKWLFNPKTQSGYVPISLSETAKNSDLKDHKSFFHYYPHTGAPEELQSITLKVYRDLENVAKTLLEWINEELPESIQSNLSMPLPDMVTDSNRTLLRILHYPAINSNTPIEPGTLRAAPHEDINLITILPHSTESGLQVKTKTGEWIPVNAGPHELIVNVGDMLAECTDNALQATTHKVVLPAKNNHTSRLSMPLFLHPRAEVSLSDRHTSKSYLDERLKELGLL